MPSPAASSALLVVCDQPILGEALVALLAKAAAPDARWVAPADLGRETAGVVVWVADGADGAAVRALLEHWPGRAPALVLVAEELDRQTMAELVGGVPGFAVLRPSTTPTTDDLVHAVQEASAGRSSIDPDLLGAVLGADDGGLSELTCAEREVAELVARGLRNETIGKRLFKSERTVEKHVASVFEKLGLRSGNHGHLDRRVAAARIVIADQAGESLGPETLDDTPL